MSERSRRGRVRRPEDGFVAAELALGVGLLVFPVACLVLTLPAWSERQVTARVIAREAARRIAREGVCNLGAARLLGATMARNLGLAPDDLQVDVNCTPGAALAPDGDVQADATVRMPAVHIPGIGSVGAWDWTARHREPADRYGGSP